MNEVDLVAKIQHRNLVKLLGCCAKRAERLLVYEYLPDKSLDTFLFDPVKRTQLDWQKHYNIISGIPRGLLNLHEDSQPCIIHRDIKANNILLDDKLNPKIADFGLARLFPEDETHIHTRVAGTCGYMAPEYAMGGHLSVNVDVYSFGMVLLEIVSGRKNTDFNLPQESQSLLEWTWRLHKRGDILNIIDSTLLESCPQEQALRCIHVGLLCTQAEAAIYPPISNVILMISSNSVTLPNPTKPAFVRFTQSQKSKSTSGDSDSKVDATSKSSQGRSMGPSSCKQLRRPTRKPSILFPCFCRDVNSQSSRSCLRLQAVHTTYSTFPSDLRPDVVHGLRLPPTLRITGNMSGFLGFDIVWPVPSKQIMVRFWIVLLISGLPFGMPQLPVSQCNNGTTYTKGSAFERNLNTVLDRLVHNGSLAGFNTSFYGQTPSTVYGLLQCRGDVSPSDCFTCSQDAGRSVRQQCGKAVGGRVWLELCYLRYENYRFFSRLDAQQYYTLVNTIKITNPDVFRNATFGLLENLAVKAVAPANKEFAAGSSYYAASRQVFGMVQCWRDISIENCRTCLNSAINVLDGCSEQEGARTLFGSCTARFEIYPFLMSYGAPSPSTEEPPTVGGPTPPSAKAPASLGAAQSPTSKKSSGNLPIILGIVGGVLLALIVCVFATRRKLKSFIFPKPVSRTQEEVIEARENVSESLIQQERTIFDLEALRVATGNFHDDNKLGEGGFGVVYKGRTSDGREIAVKKLSVRSGQGKKEFMNEVNLVAKIQHRNLVRLLGCCAEGAERLLVYEYLANKSLDTFLFDPVKRTQLDWQKRYNIISGIARGLLYLHEDSQPRIIHRDIKANNILLDDKLNPKIADFGLARFFPEDESHVQTRAAGTYGYMAPEYAMGGQLSVKADVYSFGVVLLEIVSGRKNTDFNLPQESQSLLEWTWRLHKRGDILNIIDSTLLESCLQEQALRCIHVGLLCTQAEAAIRPPISNVILMISSSSVTLPNPTKPAFVRFTQSQKSKSTSGDPDSKGDATSKSSQASPSSSSPLVYSSRNEASISDLEPR